MIHFAFTAKVIAPLFFLGVNVQNCTMIDMVNHFGNPTNIETVDNGYRFVFKRKEDVVSVYTNTKSVPYEIDDTGLETNVQYQKVHLMDSFKTLCLRRGMPQFYRFGNPSDKTTERFQCVYPDSVYSVARVNGSYKVIRISVPCNKAKVKGVI